jgi:hypothetical protein
MSLKNGKPAQLMPSKASRRSWLASPESTTALRMWELLNKS